MQALDITKHPKSSKASGSDTTSTHDEKFSSKTQVRTDKAFVGIRKPEGDITDGERRAKDKK
jgi:hypothetical protein